MAQLSTSTTPALARRIEIWPTDRLVPYAKNARTHSAEQVAQIAASIAEFGFNAPILVDSNAGIIAGHGRLLAARKLGLAEVPVVVLDHLSETQRRAYILADNKLALNAGWDEKILAAELHDLESDGVDLALVGFSDDELEDLLAGDEPQASPDVEEEEVPEEPANPVIVSGALPFSIQNNGASVGTRRALNLIQGANIGLTFLDVPASDRVNVTIALASVPGHTHAEADVTNLATDLAAKAPLTHTHAEADITALVTDLAGKAASVHTHTSSQISDATANATAGTVVLRDGSGGASFAYAAANNLWAYLDSHLNSIECGPFQSVGGPYENMAKYSEDFSVATWDKNGGTCTVSANSVVAPDGNQTADAVTASGAAGLIRQNIAGLAANGQYTFYVWLKVPSGTMTVSLGILDNGWTTWLVGPTTVTVTTSWQRFKVTGTMTGGATSLWVAIGHYTDGWTAGNVFHAWGACLQQGNDPKRGYARTWGYQAGPVAAGVACGSLLVVGKDTAESPFKVRGPGSNLADHTLLEVTAGGELIIASGSGNGYRFAEIVGASNPSGWSGCLKVKNPAGVTAGYILLYSNP